MSEIRITSIVGENGGDRVGLTTGLTVGPLTGTTGIGATITHQGHAQFAGVCTATSFSGSGANLTGVNTSLSNVKVTRTSISNISGVSYYDVTLPANCFKVEFSGMNLSSSGNSYPIFRVGTSSGIMSGGSDYKFCQNKIGASTAGVFETNSLIYTSGYIAGSSGDLHTTQATFMKCGTGERWTYTSITMEEGNTSSQVTVAHPQNGSNALTTIRYLTHDGANFDSGEISWTCWSTT